MRIGIIYLLHDSITLVMRSVYLCALNAKHKHNEQRTSNYDISRNFPSILVCGMLSFSTSCTILDMIFSTIAVRGVVEIKVRFTKNRYLAK